VLFIVVLLFLFFLINIENTLTLMRLSVKEGASLVQFVDLISLSVLALMRAVPCVVVCHLAASLLRTRTPLGL
jgi:hypothetical protein